MTRRAVDRDRAPPGPGATAAPLREIAQLHAWLAAHGAQPMHARHVLQRWLQALPEDAAPRRPAHHLPARLRAALDAPEAPLATLARESAAHAAADGAVRLLMVLADGEAVESVLLPRGGLCVSTQVGCAVGCVFCMSGRDGLRRQLGSAEIAAQVAMARRRRAVRKVVFMGMGEPAHNLDAVLAAIDLLANEGGIAQSNLVLSTVGDRRVFERLPARRVRPALALSLHSTFAARRARLLPRAPRIDPAELIARADVYARATGYPVQYQWTLLAGINDGDDEVERLAALLAGRYGVLNLIPYNAVDGAALDGTPLCRPGWERAAQIARTLHRRRVLTKLRYSAGQEVDGACGQLRARAVAVPRPSAAAAV